MSYRRSGPHVRDLFSAFGSAFGFLVSRSRESSYKLGEFVAYYFASASWKKLAEFWAVLRAIVQLIVHELFIVAASPPAIPSSTCPAPSSELPDLQSDAPLVYQIYAIAQESRIYAPTCSFMLIHSSIYPDEPRRVSRSEQWKNSSAEPKTPNAIELRCIRGSDISLAIPYVASRLAHFAVTLRCPTASEAVGVHELAHAAPKAPSRSRSPGRRSQALVKAHVKAIRFRQQPLVTFCLKAAFMRMCP